MSTVIPSVLLATTLPLSPSPYAMAIHGPEVRITEADTIAFLGDSITQLGTEKPFGYVNLVRAGLKARGVEPTFVPAGVSGNTCRQMLARLDADVLSRKPTWLFLSCGVNDAPNGYEDYRKNPGVPLDEYKAKITEIIDRAIAAGAKPVILTATPVVEEPHVANTNLVPYNAFLRETAAARGLPLFDVGSVIAMAHASKDDPMVRAFTVDGTHLNERGNRIFADVILAGIQTPTKK